jgi:hypothetical protein
LRDDFESALTFRSLFLASILSAFQAVVFQIYQVSPQSSDLYTIEADMHSSSNPPSSLSKALSSSSWPIFSVEDGSSCCHAETNSRLDGEKRAELARHPYGSQSCPSSTTASGV